MDRLSANSAEKIAEADGPPNLERASSSTVSEVLAHSFGDLCPFIRRFLRIHSAHLSQAEQQLMEICIGTPQRLGVKVGAYYLLCVDCSSPPPS